MYGKANDSEEIRHPADILNRATRPQRNSTWIPRRRDWRYATGVFRLEDIEDCTRRELTIWDELDYDIQMGIYGRERRKSKKGAGSAMSPPTKMELGGKGEKDGLATPPDEKNVSSPSRPGSITKFRLARVSKGSARAWKKTSLEVRLRLSLGSIEAIQRNLARASPTRAIGFLANSNPWSPESASVHARTEDGTFHAWFLEAVPIDAIFPPGIDLTEKEIMAFYPHHVLRKDVMTRLVGNGYRGDDIVDMQAWFRGFDKHPISAGQMDDFMKDGTKFHALEPVEDRRGRGFVPTFDDLLRGVKNLPAGKDAGVLTRCLAWYLKHTATSSSKLELNVLHTQSLFQSCQDLQEDHGQENVYKSALGEWKRDGKLTENAIENTKSLGSTSASNTENLKKSRLECDTGKESVTTKIMLPVRHLLTFPCLAAISPTKAIVEACIAKMEENKTTRLGSEEREFLVEEDGEKSLPYRGMKRPAPGTRDAQGRTSVRRRLFASIRHTTPQMPALAGDWTVKSSEISTVLTSPETPTPTMRIGAQPRRGGGGGADK